MSSFFFFTCIVYHGLEMGNDMLSWLGDRFGMGRRVYSPVCVRPCPGESGVGGYHGREHHSFFFFAVFPKLLFLLRFLRFYILFVWWMCCWGVGNVEKLV